MKKIDLIHTTLLIVAILAGYNSLSSLIGLLDNIAFMSGSIDRYSSSILYEGAQTALYAIACIILIRNGHRYAEMMLKDDPEDSWEDAARWAVDRRSLVLLLFIGVGLYMLIQSGVYAINDGYNYFTDKISVTAKDPGRYPDLHRNYVLLDLLRVTIGAFLIYAAPNLTDFIEKNIAVRLDRDKPETRPDTQSN